MNDSMTPIVTSLKRYPITSSAARPLGQKFAVALRPESLRDQIEFFRKAAFAASVCDRARRASALGVC